MTASMLPLVIGSTVLLHLAVGARVAVLRYRDVPTMRLTEVDQSPSHDVAGAWRNAGVPLPTIGVSADR